MAKMTKAQQQTIQTLTDVATGATTAAAAKATLTKVVKAAENVSGSMAGKSQGKVSRTAKRAAAKPDPKATAEKPSKPARTAKPKVEKETAAKPKPVARMTANVLGHSVTSVAKALGKLGWENDKAKAAIAALLVGEVKPATVMTALADGRNEKYNTKGVASLTKDEIRKLTAAAK